MHVGGGRVPRPAGIDDGDPAACAAERAQLAAIGAEAFGRDGE